MWISILELLESGAEGLPLVYLLLGEPVVHEQNHQELPIQLIRVQIDEAGNVLLDADHHRLEPGHGAAHRPAAPWLLAMVGRLSAVGLGGHLENCAANRQHTEDDCASTGRSTGAFSRCWRLCTYLANSIWRIFSEGDSRLGGEFQRTSRTETTKKWQYLAFFLQPEKWFSLL